ncbi:MAG: Fic/DOC family N-terminal domain-containing protein [Candidatus Nanopelagicales bacterium]
MAFVPARLLDETPALSVATFNRVASARGALAALASASRQLPNAALLLRPALRREAQSTSALEGTFAPLEEVLAAGDGEPPESDSMREVLNYVHVAEQAFEWHDEGRPLTVGLLSDLQAGLVRGTPADDRHAGRVREIQVMIGGYRGIRVEDARYIPPPPGVELDEQVRDLLQWIEAGHTGVIDPVVAAGMAHYQFEALHPFTDGNGRIGRLLVGMHLMRSKVLNEPTLSISPWFEARRADYYDGLLAVSTDGDWDRWIRFFARGIEKSAEDTVRRIEDLLLAQTRLKERVRAAGLRAETAMALIDFAMTKPIFTVREIESQLGLKYGRANALVGQLVDAQILRPYDDAVYNRRFSAPDLLAILLRSA